MGSANMYGQNYNICLDNNEDPRCAGGDNEEDHYFYFTDIVSKNMRFSVVSSRKDCILIVVFIFSLLRIRIQQGTCCEDGWTASYNATFDAQALASDQRQYNRTATEPRLDMPNTSVLPTTTSTTSIEPSTVTSSVGVTSTVQASAPAGSSGTAVPAAPLNGQQQAQAAAAPSSNPTGSASERMKMTMTSAGMGVVAFALGMAALF